MANHIKISNTDISGYVKKLTITHELVWNTKAGRTLTSTFVGRVIAKKWKLQFTTRPLSQEEVSKIVNLVETSDFFDVEFIPTNGKVPITRTFYVNSPTAEVYSYNNELENVRYASLAFNIIEQ